MSFEEEFDNIIRRKAEEENYPFDQSNWEKTSRLLDADRKAARALKLKKLYLPSALVVAVGSVGIIAFSYFTPTANSKEVASVKESVLPSERPVNQEIIGSSISPENKASQTNGTETGVRENKPNDPANVSVMAGTSDLELKAKAEKPVVMPNEIDHRTKNVPSEIKQSATKQPISVIPVASTKVKAIAEESSEEPAKGNETEDTQVANNDQEVNATENGFLPPVSSNQSPANSASQSENKTANVANENTSQVPAETEMNSENKKQEEVLSADQLSAVYALLPYQDAEGDLMSTPFIYLNRYEDYYKRNPKTHYLNIEMGGNYFLGWDAKKGKDGQGLNWYGGFNYGYYLSNKISISLGLQAYNIAGIKQPFYLASTKEYDFGSRTVYTRVTSNQLYYVAVPLKFNYAVNSTNTIGLGINAGYLVSANNTVSKYYLQDNQEQGINSATTHDKGIYKGTSKMNLMLSAHYKTQFGKRIGLNLEFNYGLTDLFKNTEAVKTIEKPMGIRLGMTYTLFDK